MGMTTSQPTLDQMEEVYDWAERRLGCEPIARRDLAAIESELTLVSSELEDVLRKEIAAHEGTPEARLMETAFQAVHQSLDWLHLYRRHATMAERIDHLRRVREAATGALLLAGQL
jgi:hypothetical protein